MAKSDRFETANPRSDLEETHVVGGQGRPPEEGATQPVDLSSSESETVAPRESATGATPIAVLDRMLGEFRLLRKLGRGGMADVYLAEQTSLKRNVALKILREDFISDETYLKRFKTEAMAAAGLNHPNIVQVYAIGSSEGLHYIAQEYVQGLNLRDLIVRQGPPDLALSLRIMKQVASALEAAGEAGIIHRDIKPENILITRKGEAKVADFGLAQLTLGEERNNLTQVGITMGTPLYMSPEQVNGQKLDIRSDLYSFGVTCYHMFAGQPPFRGETALSVAVQHLNVRPVPLADMRPDLPDSVCKIVHKMMAKNREQRYPDAASVLSEVSRLEKTLGATTDGAIPAFDASITSHQDGLRRAGRKLVRNLSAGRTARHIGLFLAGVLVVGSCSAALGWMLRTENPLDVVSDHATEIEVLKTAQQQLQMADILGIEPAYQAVLDNFTAPKDAHERRRAHEWLGEWYLAGRRFPEAKEHFQQLADTTGSPEFKAKGLAGLAVIASYEGNKSEFQQILSVELYGLLSNESGGGGPGRIQDQWRRILGDDLSRELWSQIDRNKDIVDSRTRERYGTLAEDPVDDNSASGGDGNPM